MATDALNEKLDQFKQQFDLDIPNILLQEAFTHPSYHNQEETVRSYEQLETLGDTVLDLIVTKQLIQMDPDIEPGRITHLRSTLVNNQSLANLGTELGVDTLIRADEGYDITQRDLADMIEALFGSIYIHRGIEETERFYNLIKKQLKHLSEYGKETDKGFYNPIGRLQEFCQKLQLGLPLYVTKGREGPDHEPVFEIEVSVTVDDKELSARALGSNKKKAKRDAAGNLLEKLKQHPEF